MTLETRNEEQKSVQTHTDTCRCEWCRRCAALEKIRMKATAEPPELTDYEKGIADGYKKALFDAAQCVKQFADDIPIELWEGTSRELMKMFAVRAAGRIYVLKPITGS